MPKRVNTLNEEQSQYHYIPGATTIGIVCKDSVILASEKRVSYGSFVLSRSGKKVFKITKTIGAACAGLVSDMQILVREINAYAKLFNLEAGRPITVKSAAKMVSNLLFSQRLVPLITQTIIGGVDNDGPALYILDLLGSNIRDNFNAVGSGAEIAIGILENGYREDLVQEDGKKLATQAIRSAISRDAMSGDGIDFLIITEEGIEEETLRL